MIVGFIEPVGTSFQSAKLDRAAKSTIAMIAKGLTWWRKKDISREGLFVVGGALSVEG
jgi:hypothetical protein